LGRHAAAFLGFSIPISIALDSILLALVALLWVASGGWKQKIEIIRANKVALSALALFAMLVAGLSYGTRDPGYGLRFLGKYLDLLFIPIFITLFQDARTRDLALRWFCAAMVVSFVLAELMTYGLLAGNPILPRHLDSVGAFKHAIPHGLLSAFAAFVFALLAHREVRWPHRVLFVVLALVAVKNVMLIAISRTGYLLLALLAIYFCFLVFKKRGLVIAFLLPAALFVAAYGGSQTIRTRIDLAAVEALEWRPDKLSGGSVNLRLEWYWNSLRLVRDHPLLGTGTGSFPRVYAEAVKDSQVIRTANPHNEYLLIAVQTGLVGLALLLHLFWRQLSLARRLASPLETHLATGLVIAIAAGCVFNSLLLDHTEGLFYAWFTGLLFAGVQSPRES
jgi:O-antigen ligase